MGASRHQLLQKKSLSDDISDQGNGFLACDDEEMAGFVSTFEADKAPSSIASLPYWQLRRVSTTVKTGGLFNAKYMCTKGGMVQ